MLAIFFTLFVDHLPTKTVEVVEHIFKPTTLEQVVV
jgi:hypothetical protein